MSTGYGIDRAYSKALRACTGSDTERLDEKSSQMTHFWMIRQEDCAAQAAGDAANDVDQADTSPTNQLLHVSHDKHLETNRYQQRKQPETIQ